MDSTGGPAPLATLLASRKSDFIFPFRDRHLSIVPRPHAPAVPGPRAPMHHAALDSENPFKFLCHLSPSHTLSLVADRHRQSGGLPLRLYDGYSTVHDGTRFA
jgi:hypothetical protein